MGTLIVHLCNNRNARHFINRLNMALRLVTSRFLRNATRLSSGRRSMSEMAFTFAAPNGVHYDSASVKQVDVPSLSGSFGILPNHVPALAVLSPGVVTVYEDDGGQRNFLFPRDLLRLMKILRFRFLQKRRIQSII